MLDAIHFIRLSGGGLVVPWRATRDLYPVLHVEQLWQLPSRLLHNLAMHDFISLVRSVDSDLTFSIYLLPYGRGVYTLMKNHHRSVVSDNQRPPAGSPQAVAPHQLDRCLCAVL